MRPLLFFLLLLFLLLLSFISIYFFFLFHLPLFYFYRHYSLSTDFYYYFLCCILLGPLKSYHQRDCAQVLFIPHCLCNSTLFIRERVSKKKKKKLSLYTLRRLVTLSAEWHSRKYTKSNTNAIKK